MTDCGQWGRTRSCGAYLSASVEAEVSPPGSCLWASILSFSAPPSRRTCLCAFWALTALFLAFQRNELWILNDFMPSSLAALPRGVSAEIFNSFACQRLVTVYISGTFWKPVASCLSALQQKVWAEQKLNRGRVFCWLDLWEEFGYKSVGVNRAVAGRGTLMLARTEKKTVLMAQPSKAASVPKSPNASWSCHFLRRKCWNGRACFKHMTQAAFSTNRPHVTPAGY